MRVPTVGELVRDARRRWPANGTDPARAGDENVSPLTTARTPRARVVECRPCGASLDVVERSCPYCGQEVEHASAGRSRALRAEAALREAGRHRARLDASLDAAAARARDSLEWLAWVTVGVTVSVALAVAGALAGGATVSVAAAALGLAVITLAAELRGNRTRSRARRGLTDSVDSAPSATLPVGDCPSCGASAHLDGEGSSCAHCAAPLWPDAVAERLAEELARIARVSLETERLTHRSAAHEDAAAVLRWIAATSLGVVIAGLVVVGGVL